MRRWLSNYFLGIDDWRDLNKSDLVYLAMPCLAVFIAIVVVVMFW